jgi:hypothetical protein
MNTLVTPAAKSFLPSLFASKTWYGSVLRFFASVRLAILILTSLMGILATGTIMESLHGTDAARILIYNTFWFSLVLLILGMNVTTAALSRYPWKLRHVGFVITHIGIILVLVGSFMTQKFMIDGQMAITEGATEYRITLPDPVLYIFSEKEQRTSYVNLEKKAFPWEGRREIEYANDGETFPFDLTLTAFYPKAKRKEKIIASESGMPAVKVRLKNDFVDQQSWLLKKSGSSEIQMGPAKLIFAEEMLKDSLAPAEDSPYLEFQFEDKSIPVFLKKDLKLPATFELEGTPYKIEVLRTFKNAMVDGKELIEHEAEGSNPAVQMILRGKDLEERHTVFANYPDFPTVHGMKPSAAGARVFYRLPNAGSRGEAHEIRFVEKDGKLWLQIQEGLKVSTHEVVKGQAVPTGWMGNLTVTVEEYFSRADTETTLVAQPNTSESEEAISAIRLEVNAGDQTKVLSLTQNMRQEIQIGKELFHFMYGEKSMPAGFKLELRDFRVTQYPGTDDPATFESDVTLKDDSRGLVKEANISMNKPLVHRGYRIYQAGYSQPEGQPEISIFSVGKDPGVPVKYLGAIVMVGGIITLFYTRRFSTSGKSL